MIGTREIDGYRALTIASGDGELEAAFVPEAGMVGCSLLHRGEEILGQRNGLRAYVDNHSTMGIPLLYPWANRLGRDRFASGGRTVDLTADSTHVKRDANGLPMHGLLIAAPGWSVLRHEPLGDGAVVVAGLDWSREQALLDLYPFPHRLTLEARIDAAGLTISTTIEAGGEGGVPVAFGFHPYLSLPGVSRQRWMVELPVSEQLGLDDSGLPSGERTAVELRAGALGERSFDDLYLAPVGGAPFAISGGGRRIELSMDSAYRFAQLYSPAAGALIAIEPMTAPTNALVSGEHATVPAGKAMRAGFTIGVLAAG